MGGALTRMIGFQSSLAPAPTIVGTNTSTSSVASSSWTAFSALDLSDCDTAAAFVALRSGTINPTITIDSGSSSAGWNAVGAETFFGGNISGYSCAVRLFVKQAPSASETLVLNGALNSNWGCLIYRVDGADTVTQAGVSGTTGNANPPNLDNGSPHNTLWLSLAALASGTPPSALPSGYANAVNVTNTTLLTVQVGDLTNSAQSEDPGAFTNASQRWGAKTIAFYHT